MSDTNHRTSVFLGLQDHLSPGLRRITGEVNRTAGAFARLGSRTAGGLGGGLTMGLRGLSGAAGLGTRALLGLGRAAGSVVGGGLRAMTSAVRTTVGVVAGLTRTTLALGTALGGLAAVGAFKGIMAGAGREAQFKSLQSIEGSADRARQSMQDLKKIAAQPGIGLDEAIQGYSGLRAVKAPSGLAKGLISELGNAVATNAGGPEQLLQVLRGVQQTFGKGKIQAEELNQQILEAAPMVRQAIEKAFGTGDAEKITAILEKRGLTVQQFWERVLVQMRQLPRAGDGAKNALENVGIAGRELAITFGQGFLGDDGAKRIGSLGKWLESLDPIAKRLGQSLRRVFDRVSDAAGRMVGQFKLAWRALQAGDAAGLGRMNQGMVLLAEGVQKGATWLRVMGARAQQAGRQVGKLSGDFAATWRALHGGQAEGAGSGLGGKLAAGLTSGIRAAQGLLAGGVGAMGEAAGRGLAQLVES